MSLITGLKQGTTGEEVPVLVDSSGRLVVTGVSGGPSGGGSSDTTEATQLQVLSKVTSIDTKVGSVDSKVLTDAQLRASPVNVSVTSNTLPSGAATAANQSTTNSTLNSIDSKTPALQSGSVPVVVTSNTLPSGAATAANQSTGNTSLSNIDAKTPALVGGAVPVTITSNTLATNAATAANQTTGNTSLASIDSKVPVLVSGRTPVDGSGVTQPITLVARSCLGRETIALTAGGTASLTPPNGSLAANIQADGATIRVRQDGSLPTATTGTRIDDGVIYTVDTLLTNVKLYGVSATNVQVCYFDRA